MILRFAALAATAILLAAAAPTPDLPAGKAAELHATAVVYVFNQHGKPEFITAGIAGQNPDLRGISNDLKHLLEND